jgi:tRNA 2-selenouridine synthase
MSEGHQILIDADVAFRARHLTSEYTGLEPGNVELLSAIDKIRRYMGNEPVDALQTLVKEGNFETVAKELMVNYYDPMYNHSIKKYDFEKTIDVTSFEDAADQLEKWLEKLKMQAED